MGVVRHSYHIDAPPERVWEVATAVDRIPEWNSSVVEVRDASARRAELGTTYRTLLRVVGQGAEARWQVTRAEPPHLLQVRGTSPTGVRATATNRFDAAGKGTLATVEVEYQIGGGFLSQLAGAVFAEQAVQREVRQSSEAFKALVESEAGAER